MTHKMDCIDCGVKDRKMKKIRINRAALIEQITDCLWNTATDKQTFAVSNILLGTNHSEEKYQLADPESPSPSPGATDDSE